MTKIKLLVKYMVKLKELKTENKILEKNNKEKLEEVDYIIYAKKELLIEEKNKNEILKKKYGDIFFKDQITEIISMKNKEKENKENNIQNNKS